MGPNAGIYLYFLTRVKVETLSNFLKCVSASITTSTIPRDGSGLYCAFPLGKNESMLENAFGKMKDIGTVKILNMIFLIGHYFKPTCREGQ